MLARYRLLAANGVLALTLLGSHWGRNIESATVAEPRFLQALDLPFRGWKTEPREISNGDLEILQPDAVLYRHYQSPKSDSVELLVVAGHRKRTVHTPGYCMVGGGWEVVSQQSRTIEARGASIPVVQAVMAKERQGLVVTYFFTDGTFSTRNIMELTGVSLWKRLRAEVPLNALVRIVTPVTSTPAEAAKLSDEFAATTVPKILSALRGARLRG